ncbi:hypothetical protein ABIA33_001825 [Streptacidiphilus sp. MAP12-16]|uniref:sigma-70 region 4 domain-containing protein n=1 Tax=Streptacidiphilus sp. MAP12-16 TaxID=3156300 RepID=UPI003514448A
MNWPFETRRQVLNACRNGRPYPETAERFGVPQGTIGYWVFVDRARRGEPAPRRASTCPRCDSVPLDRQAYSYLLGLYLGDGHIVSKPKNHHLSIYCCDGWPGLLAEAESAIVAVMPGYSNGRNQKPGCTEVKSYTMHWTCLLPQHGPGMKHTRPIVLDPWQSEIVAEHPWPLIRGLIHSDGCRVTNWTTTKLADGRTKRYEYPRYIFTNKSDDIREIYSDALDAVGVEWRVSRRGADPYHVSVARRASVALMDEHVGPKY